MLEHVMALRKGGNVRRYHIEQLIGEQTNATHSFHMAVLALALWPGCSVNLITAILYHDIPEGEVGDLPGPAKRRFPGLWDVLHDAEAQVRDQLGLQVKLAPGEETQFRIVDALEACFFGLEQHRLGNCIGRVLFEKNCAYVLALEPEEQVRRLLDELKREVYGV